jgi:hypothetical protein
VITTHTPPPNQIIDALQAAEFSSDLPKSLLRTSVVIAANFHTPVAHHDKNGDVWLCATCRSVYPCRPTRAIVATINRETAQ